MARGRGQTGQALGGFWGQQGGEGGEALQAGEGGQGVEGLRVLEQLGQRDGTGAQARPRPRPALTYIQLGLVQFHAGGDKGPHGYDWCLAQRPAPPTPPSRRRRPTPALHPPLLQLLHAGEGSIVHTSRSLQCGYVEV